LKRLGEGDQIVEVFAEAGQTYAGAVALSLSIRSRPHCKAKSLHIPERRL